MRDAIDPVGQIVHEIKSICITRVITRENHDLSGTVVRGTPVRARARAATVVAQKKCGFQTLALQPLRRNK